MSAKLMVHVLSGRTCKIIERYSHNWHPHYADFRVAFDDGAYRIIRQRHLREPMPGEARAFKFAPFLALQKSPAAPITPLEDKPDA